MDEKIFISGIMINVLSLYISIHLVNSWIDQIISFMPEWQRSFLSLCKENIFRAVGFEGLPLDIKELIKAQLNMLLQYREINYLSFYTCTNTALLFSQPCALFPHIFDFLLNS